MRRVIWSTRAKARLPAYLTELKDIDPELAKRARREIDASLELLSLHPRMARPSQRWEGCREKSLTDWHKIAVYDFDDDRLEIVLFVDSRQDLGRVRL